MDFLGLLTPAVVAAAAVLAMVQILEAAALVGAELLFLGTRTQVLLSVRRLDRLRTVILEDITSILGRALDLGQ